MATGETYLESDGKAVTVSLSYSVDKTDVVVADGWYGIAADDGDSGDEIALSIAPREYQFEVPSGLGASKGDVVYIDVTDLTGHIPDDTAYGTTGGSGLVPLCRCTEDQSDTTVTGILLLGQWNGYDGSA